MSPEETVRARLLEITAVAAMVSDRVYMLKLKQGPTLPAIRVQMIDEGTESHLRGHGGINQTRVQVDVYTAEASGGDPYATALDLSKAVHGDGRGDIASGLSGWIGTAGSPSLRVLGVFRVDRAVDYDAEERREVRVRQDYMVTWKE